MALRARLLLLNLLIAFTLRAFAADAARFDLVGPSIDVRVTRGADTLPIASVPNLQPGDKLWLHPDLPASQSIHYLLVCVFLRGTTNPPPNDWFLRIPTWDKKIRQEGVFVTVPAEAQQAVLFMAPETGGDFATLRSAVQGRPGIFVRASQDLAEAGFEQARIEKYLASIRRVPPSDSAELQKHSDLLARTLALKPNADCFKRPVDTQFTCLTQVGSQTLLDDGHGQTIAAALSTGPNADLINAASYTRLGGAGAYSAYVGAIMDLVKVMGNLHTAQFQYIPAISFPQGEAMNLRLNTPPSFHNPKSVLVIGLPAVQAATPPPLRSADANHITCLLEPTAVLPIEGAPLVFSTDFAHNLALHLNTPPGAPAEPDIHLIPDAYLGGLLLQRAAPHHVELRDSKPLSKAIASSTMPVPQPEPPSQPEPIQLTATIQGHWGFDTFTGPTLTLQQLPGKRWEIVLQDIGPSPTLIVGHNAKLLVTSSGSACIHTVTAHPVGSAAGVDLPFKLSLGRLDPNILELTVPREAAVNPGDLHLAIQQFGQPAADDLSARTFTEFPKIDSIRLHAGDRTVTVTGSNLAEVASLTVGDLVFTPDPGTPGDPTLRLSLPVDSPAPPTHTDDRLPASINLRDGRSIGARVTVAAPRPIITLLGKTSEAPPAPTISLSDPTDIPLSQRLTFTLKSPVAFPRNGQVEIETVDGALRTVLTLAPSGGLLLQDPHTIVATLDPLRSFGPSAFGQLHFRAVFPAATAATSDWQPLGTLVRLPFLTQLQCPTDTALPCTLTGSNLFLLDSVSADPAFADPTPIPDGFTGSSLPVPHPYAATLFLHLRDDRAPINSAVIPETVPPANPPREPKPHRTPPASR